MLTQSVPQEKNLSTTPQKRERLDRLNTREDVSEIREALRAKSATAFVVSRLVWRIENGLNTSREVRQ